MQTILIFENNTNVANDLENNLQYEGYKIIRVDSPLHFPTSPSILQGVDLFIIDLMMGNEDLPDEIQKESNKGLITGFVVFKEIVLKSQNYKINKDKPVIILTGYNNDVEISEIEKQITRCKVIRKPADHNVIFEAIKGMLEQ